MTGEQRLKVLTLRIFGELRLLDEAGEGVPYPEKGLLAMCYLFTSSRYSRSRAQLSRFLWGDLDPSRSSANLRKMLSRLAACHSALGVEPLSAKGDYVQLDTGVVGGDLAELAALADMKGSPDIGRVMSLCRGEFLAGVSVANEEARFWLEAQRLRFSDVLTRALHAEADRASTAAHHSRAREAALQILEINPHDEAAYRHLIRALSSEGRIEEARSFLERCRKRLWTELGAEPEPETIEVSRRLRGTGGNTVTTQERSRFGNGASFSSPDNGKAPKLTLLDAGDAASSVLLEDVTIGLCRLRTITVVAPHSARLMTDPSTSAQALHRLSLDYILETRVGPRNGASALFMQLVQADTREVLWAERIRLAADHLAASYKAMTVHIVDAVAGEIGRREIERRLHRDPGAYRHFLEGMRHLRRIDLPEVRCARRAFRAALREDQSFAPAWGGLSRTLHLEWLLTARGDATLLEEARKNAARAVMADPADPSGHRELGVTSLFTGSFDESIEAFERAELIAPQHADLLADYADTLVHSARPTEALAKVERAIELNPLPPDIYLWTAAGANYFLERYDDALASLALMADQTPASRLAAACHGMLGNTAEARVYARGVKEIHPDFQIDHWLSILPSKESWQNDHYREGLRKAGL